MSPVAIGFVVYLIIIFVVGIVTAHLNKSLPDFFLAGRRLREESERLGTLTVPRFFELRFSRHDPAIRFVATGIIAFCFTFYIAAQLDTAGKSLEQTFGWGHFTGVLVGATVIVFYTIMGGFFAVAWTDFVQGWIMILTLVLLPLVTLAHLGWWGGLAEKINAIDPQLLTLSGGRSGWLLLAGMLIGFFTVIIWDNIPWGGHLYSLVPGFLAALLAVVVVSLVDRRGEAATIRSRQE